MSESPYDTRAPPIVKFSQESESASNKNHPVQKYRKNPLNSSTVKIDNNFSRFAHYLMCSFFPSTYFYI